METKKNYCEINERLKKVVESRYRDRILVDIVTKKLGKAIPCVQYCNLSSLQLKILEVSKLQ